MLLADKMALQWAEIEGAMKFANCHPAFRPAVESLVDTYFAVIDAMAAELERRLAARHTGIVTTTKNNSQA